MKKKKAPKTEISDDLRERVITYWETHTNNTIPDIMKEFEITEAVGHSIINRYFRERFGN